MGCGCLIFLASAVSPRLGIFLLWVFTDRTTIAFDSFWIGLLGFLLLPWTALAWIVAYAPLGGVSGFGWFLVGLGFIVDIGTHLGGGKADRDRRRSPASA
jgi:hypothetical protein